MANARTLSCTSRNERPGMNISHVPRITQSPPARARPASTLTLLQLLHSTIGVIDGAVGVSECACVRVRDRQPAERFARHLTRRLPAFPAELVGQRIVFRGVAVRPPVDRDFHDVAGGLESTRT